MSPEPEVAAAAEVLLSARALVVTAGAGMGVDSGLPDFRGDQGFWKAYPPYERLGISFVEAANPSGFEGDPEFGWGFYGHRLGLYRATVPHRGFAILRSWVDSLGLECFVVTSNVDGQFQAAGFDPERIHEVHGSIHHLQCTTPCSEAIWPNREEVPVDLDTMRALHVPRCPRCREVSRPNILMFGDWAWLADRSHGQQRAFEAWLTGLGGRAARRGGDGRRQRHRHHPHAHRAAGAAGRRQVHPDQPARARHRGASPVAGHGRARGAGVDRRGPWAAGVSSRPQQSLTPLQARYPRDGAG